MAVLMKILQVVLALSLLVLVHEFGHYLDWKCGFPSRTDTFKELYEKENILI